MLRLHEMFEDTKGVTGSRKSRTNRQHNEKGKRNNNILQNTTKKRLKIEQHQQ